VLDPIISPRTSPLVQIPLGATAGRCRHFGGLPAVTPACDRSGEQDVAARDLSRALDSRPEVVDTAAQRADSQFQTCLYVYDTEEKLRECLVLKNQWPAQDAARAIAVYKAEIKRTSDSLRARLKYIADSIEGERESMYAVLARRRDSIRVVAERRQAAQYAVRDSQLRAESLYAASFPV
jgi:hypothetical protein